MSETQEKKVALVTGGNKGIGFEVCKQLAKQGIQVILTARSEEKGKEAVEKLKADNLEVNFCSLDVSSDDSVQKASEHVEKEFGRLDILVNNAGIMIDNGGMGLNPDISVIKETFDTNALGTLRMSSAFIPIMEKNRYGRIVNFSSGMGQLQEMGGGFPGYRLSKLAINGLTKILCTEVSPTSNILINSMCPGWVKTDMGGENAMRTVEEGADTAVWLATLPDDGPNGQFFRDRRRIRW